MYNVNHGKYQANELSLQTIMNLVKESIPYFEENIVLMTMEYIYLYTVATDVHRQELSSPWDHKVYGSRVCSLSSVHMLPWSEKQTHTHTHTRTHMHTHAHTHTHTHTCTHST